MKRFLSIIAIIITIVILGGWYALFSNNGIYATTDYYVKIVSEPKFTEGYYEYEATVYNKDAKPRKLILSTKSKLEQNQYYLIQWEEKRQIVSSNKKIEKSEIDNSIIKKLDNQQ
jgi:uncharacterized protein YxeA